MKISLTFIVHHQSYFVSMLNIIQKLYTVCIQTWYNTDTANVIQLFKVDTKTCERHIDLTDNDVIIYQHNTTYMAANDMSDYSTLYFNGNSIKWMHQCVYTSCLVAFFVMPLQMIKTYHCNTCVSLLSYNISLKRK